MSAGINRPWQRSRSRNDVPTSNESALAEWVDWYRVPLRGIRLGRDRVRAANDGAGSLPADLRAVSRDQVPGRCSRTRAHRRQLHERVGKPRRRRAARVHPKAHYTQGFTHTGAPIIANGVVVSGINGCELFTDDGCFITGHDPATGAELWRTSTVALPGDPNSGSWRDMPLHLRGGGDTWIPGSYDPDLDLFSSARHRRNHGSLPVEACRLPMTRSTRTRRSP